MRQYFVIVNSWESDCPMMDRSGEPTTDIRYARKFALHEDAVRYVRDRAWQLWTEVIPVCLPVLVNNH